MVEKVYCVEHNPTGKIMCAGQAFHTSYCHICGNKMVFATTYDELLCEKCSSKYSQCAKCGTTDLNNNLKERNIKQGRVEGFKEILKELELSDEWAKLEKNILVQSKLRKQLRELHAKFEKRLKELEGKGVN